jgi:hypothetical protein
MKPEEQLLKFQHSIGIKVQSVALPNKDYFYAIKTEEQIMDWLRNKIHNQHSAYFQFSNKYSQNDEEKSWDKNKMQNQRFLETTNG